MPCSVCGGRVIKTETGAKCMNPSCDSAGQSEQNKNIQCTCGEVMGYQGLNQLGEPLYKCQACGRTTKL